MSSQQPDGMWVKAEVVMALEAEIATLRQERDEAKAEQTRALLRGTVSGYVGGENAPSKFWRGRAEAAEAENARLRAATDELVARIAMHKKDRRGDYSQAFNLLSDVEALLAPPAETSHE